MALSKIDVANMVENEMPQANIANNINFRNIIINGDMSIAQRATSATGLGNNDSGYHTVDRFKFVENNAPTCEFTQTQSTDVPTGQGFAKSLKMDCTTAQTSLAGDDFIYINTSAEGQNLQYLKKGTSSAESVTLSFWVKSNKTGTYIFEIIDRDNSRAISKSYTISSADTWEKKTITYPGDTTGALDNDNARSFELIFWMLAGANFQSGTLQTSWGSRTTTNDAVGQVNLADSTSNEWYVTGVQLEVGETASDFEFLPFDINYQRCKRYYQKTYEYGTAPGTATEDAWAWYGADYNLGITSTFQNQGVKFEMQMRSSPSMTTYDGSGNSGKCTRYRVGSGVTHNQASSVDKIMTTNFRHFGQGTAATGNIAFHYEADAEL